MTGDYSAAMRRLKRASDNDTSHLSTEESEVERVKRRKRCHKVQQKVSSVPQSPPSMMSLTVSHSQPSDASAANGLQPLHNPPTVPAALSFPLFSSSSHPPTVMESHETVQALSDVCVESSGSSSFRAVEIDGEQPGLIDALSAPVTPVTSLTSHQAMSPGTTSAPVTPVPTVTSYQRTSSGTTSGSYSSTGS